MDPANGAGKRGSDGKDSVHMTTTVEIASETGFQEDKEFARELRRERILPALEGGEDVRLDFSNVEYATQSFVHALIGEALKRHGIEVLDHIEFHGCTKQLRSVVELVVNYSLGGFGEEPESAAEAAGEEESTDKSTQT